MIVECPNCKTEIEFDSICSACKKSISIFSRIVYFGDREAHLVITFTSILGIILGGIFGYFVSPDSPANSMLTFMTVIVCANVGILPGYLIGKTTLMLFNSVRSQSNILQYSSIIIAGGCHGLIFNLVLNKASGWNISWMTFLTGIISGILINLFIVLYIRKNVGKLENWW